MATKPNIIFFFTDQQRWDTCGCYGQKLPTTPNLDRMAAEGVLFENAFTCQPVCGPARAVLQTGKYATETGCYRNDVGLPLKEKTIAQLLSQAGYATGYVGKWHLASSGGMEPRGTKPEDMVDYARTAIPPERRGGYKDFWVAADLLEFTSGPFEGTLFNGDMEEVHFKGYRVDALTDYALDFIRSRTDEKPFFMFLSFLEPHHQNNLNRYVGPEGSADKFRNYVVPGDLEGTGGDWRENYPDYLGAINSLDMNLGRIRAELERKGMADNTVVIFTSDHGSHFRTRNSEYKRSCHDACTHVPMVIDGPGFKGGKRVKEMVSLIDIPPTIVAAGGVTPPDFMRGRPLQEAASGAARNWPDDVFIQISEEYVGRSVRTHKWKYSVWVPPTDAWHGWDHSGSDVYFEQFLYDLEADPNEKNNLVKDPAYAKVRREMAARLVKHMVEIGEKEPKIEPAEKAVVREDFTPPVVTPAAKIKE